jgi:hypothetical protein
LTPPSNGRIAAEPAAGEQSISERRKMRWLSGALFALLPLTVHAQQPDTVRVLGEDERIATLALLWQEVNYNFAYFDQVPELDWTARFTAYLPQVRAARDTYEFYRVLQGFLAGLNDGHTLVFFPDSIIDRRPVDVPWVELRRRRVAHRAAGYARPGVRSHTDRACGRTHR